MKVLLTTVGSRGDVQPILALALELRTRGHQALVCAAPNFRTWVESFGISFLPLGPDVEKWTRERPEGQTTQKLPSRARLRNLAGHAVAEQFRVLDVSRSVTTDYPWLAADPVLAPKASPIRMQITQTGAWFLPDPNPLPDDLETFLASGEPPLYFGFGSMRAAAHTGQLLIEAARALGRRAIISQGRAQLGVIDAGADCLSIGDVNHEKLLPRVAAVVHHGGAGTTTAAARAGRPQVVVPHLYDQHYWARRVRALGIGVSIRTFADLTAGALVDALRECLKPEMTALAQAVASRMELHGARLAAERLISTFG